MSRAADMVTSRRSKWAVVGFWILLVAGLAATLASCGGGGDEGGQRDYFLPSLTVAELERCGGAVAPPGFRCGEIETPLERAKPSLGTATIGFAVRERDDRKRPSRGAIFAVEGGPGYASTGTANAYTKLFGSLLRRHELVLVDMRGTGTSGALDCPDLQRGRAPDWIALADCARSLGPRFESYRTSAAADDIDDVREALGYDRIALYGDSYGTFLAQSYAYRHPDGLGAMVLDSAYPAFGEDPWYPSLLQTGIRAISIACRRSPGCDGDPRARLERLAEHLRATRRSVGPLIDAIGDAGYDPPGAYLRIDRAAAELLRGNPGPWNRLTRAARPGYRHLTSYSHADEFVVGCNDYPMIWDSTASEPERREQLEQAIQEYDPHAFEPFTPREVALSAEIGYLECLTWPRPTNLYEPAVDPGAEAPDVPVLVVSGELDDVTTPAEGRAVAAQFPDSKYFEARNAGHVASLYDSSSPPAREIRRFLRHNLG